PKPVGQAGRFAATAPHGHGTPPCACWSPIGAAGATPRLLPWLRAATDRLGFEPRRAVKPGRLSTPLPSATRASVPGAGARLDGSFKVEASSRRPPGTTDLTPTRRFTSESSIQGTVRTEDAAPGYAPMEARTHGNRSCRPTSGGHSFR